MELSQWQAQLRKGAAELAVLSILVRQERYGLQILDAANDRGVIVTDGALYPLLSRLETEGKIQARWEVEDAAHPRKYYRLTGKGQAAQLAMKTAWIDFRETMTRLVEICDAS